MNSELSRAAAAVADLARTFDSADQAPERIQRAAEMLRQLLRSDACAFVSLAAGSAPALVVVPVLHEEEAARLERDARALLAAVREGGPQRPSPRSPGGRPHLAVPLIGMGGVVGMLLVERAGAEYGDRELQLLAIGAAQLGAYLTVLEARENQRRSERALAEALARTRAADERKVHFLNVLSHELRNPLAPLRNAVYVLARGDPASEPAQRARAVIGRQVEHLARLLDDLLDVARVSTGKVHLRRAPLELGEVVRRTVEDHRAVFLQNGVQLTFAGSAPALWVDGDETRIAQVVGNLLGNALKFTSPGGHVEVALGREAPETAAIRVRDDGIGMSAETLGRLFVEFAQGEETLRRGQAGLGLGLALAKGLIELHGGVIEARSEGQGRGAEFVVRLPLAGAAGAPTPSGGTPRLARTSPRRILVVDDNRDAAESTRDLLELGGHAVEVAFDGPAGVARARSSRPDVVLCDIGLPGMNGYEVARALRGDPELARTLLVAVTGFGSAEDRERAMRAGFHRHVVKPVALSTLEQLLAEAPAPPGEAALAGPEPLPG